VVDKTGTLTAGEPQVVTMLPAAGCDEQELLRLAAAAESPSEHPLGRAIVAAAQAQGLTLPVAGHFQSTTGGGVTATIEDQEVRVGQWSHIAAEAEQVPPEIESKVQTHQVEGRTVVWASAGSRLLGALVIADPLKDTTPAAIAQLHKLGLRIVMLTGDSAATAASVAKTLAIDEVAAGVSPEGKLQCIRQLRAVGRVVAMAGDGVNDAPALAAADVGIAMGTGSDVAIESAGVTLLGGDLGGVVRALTLSRGTMRNIRQNLLFAFGYNALGIPIAAGVLYPWLGWLLSPMIGAAAMSLSCVSLITNALRLRKLPLD
jgi:P-type Cu+ transporter